MFFFWGDVLMFIYLTKTGPKVLDVLGILFQAFLKGKLSLGSQMK